MALRQLQIDTLPPELKSPAELASKNAKQTLITAVCTFPPLVYQQEKGMEIALKTMEPRLFCALLLALSYC